MWPYYVIYAFLSMLSGLDRIIIKREDKYVIYLSCSVLLICFAGFRYNNADYFAYYDGFLDVVNGRPDPFSDAGFNFLNYIVSLTTSSPVIFLLAIAGLSVGINFNSFRSYTPYFFTAILLYFVHNFQMKEMIQIRVGLASAICLFSVRYLVKRRVIFFTLLFLVALSIHFSVLIWVTVPILFYFKPTGKQLKYVLLISLCIGIVYPFGQIVKAMSGLDQLDGRINDYLAYGNSAFGSSMGIFTNLNALKSIFFSVLYLMIYERHKDILGVYYFPILCAYIFGTCWMLLFNDFAILSGRLSNIMLSGEPILLSFVPVIFKKDSRWFPYLLSVMLAFIMLLLNEGDSKVEPYNFYFLR